ncbi:hypothetical protein PT126_08460 [Erysipelothrix rhusiopathiae]|nr:hypothetical protein [Erysipelothrix rhusiopathiae]MDE8194125.1 hypothetical protein [Erysipelothrix rhusiopathiae]
MIIEFEKHIYDHRTKSNFKEVMNCYTNGIYRASIVMLYSTVVSDLLYKLMDLRDFYNDRVAIDILKKVDHSRNGGYDLSKWENDLITLIEKDMEIIDNQTSLAITTIKKYRNLSAHPSMDTNYELHNPSKQMVMALIVESVNGLLSKPPLFASRITDTILLDNERLRDIYSFSGMRKEYRNYLNTQYFSKMSDKIKINLFKDIWKMVMKADDQRALDNQWINSVFLRIMIEDNHSLFIDALSEGEVSLCSIGELSLHSQMAMNFSILFPELYKQLSNDNIAIINKESDAEVNWYISVFRSENLTTHVDKLILNIEDHNKSILLIPENWTSFFINLYHDSGLIHKLNDLFIKIYANSYSFDCADIRFSEYIIPILDYLNESEVISLIESSCSNGQIFARGLAATSNTNIVEYSISKNFKINYDDYPNFKYLSIT